MYKIEDFFEKLKYNDSHTNIIRIHLKKEAEVYYVRTEDFHFNMLDKIEEYIGYLI